MGKLIDLTGQRFGRLLVIERADNTPAGQAKWKCKCDCRNITVVNGGDLRNGRVVSCGCYSAEMSAVRAAKRNSTHGHYYSRLHRIWTGMKTRCYNAEHCHYDRYGGRGIKVCEEWLHNFQAFWDWAVETGYQDDLSIDRIDNDKGYSPENCRWAKRSDQARNKSSNRVIEIDGESKALSAWCEQYGVNYYTAHARINKSGWTPEEALGLVPRKKI